MSSLKLEETRNVACKPSSVSRKQNLLLRKFVTEDVCSQMQVLPYAANMYAKVLMAFKFSGRSQCGNFSCCFSLIGKELKYEISQLFFSYYVMVLSFTNREYLTIVDFIDCLHILSDQLFTIFRFFILVTFLTFIDVCLCLIYVFRCTGQFPHVWLMKICMLSLVSLFSYNCLSPEDGSC